jgi:DNA-binding transcriptional MerR regulator
MTIGVLSKQTQASPRSIRYYEANGLLKSRRTANGYRDYDSEAIQIVKRIRWLLATGLSLRSIRVVLHCVSGSGNHRIELCPKTREVLEREVERIDSQVEKLRSSRKLLIGALAPEK